MTAPASETVEQDAARDEDMVHIFCAICNGFYPKTRAGALCGTVAQMHAVPTGSMPGPRCVVCVELNEFTCEGCGR